MYIKFYSILKNKIIRRYIYIFHHFPEIRKHLAQITKKNIISIVLIFQLIYVFLLFNPFATGNTLLCGWTFEQANASELEDNLEEMFPRYW